MLPAAIAFFGIFAYSLLASGAKPLSMVASKPSRPEDVPLAPGYLVIMTGALGDLLDGWKKITPTKVLIDEVVARSSSIMAISTTLPPDHAVVSRPIAGREILLVIVNGNAETWEKRA